MGGYCLLTAANRYAAWAAALTVPGKVAYCLRHGYSFIHEGPTGFDQSRPPFWGKIQFLLKHLDRFEWMFWSDADAVIQNHERRLEEFTTHDTDIVLAREPNGWCRPGGINTGHLFVRNSEAGWHFLNTIWQNKAFIHSRQHEQGAANFYVNSKDAFCHRITVVPEALFNASFSRCTKDSFIVHVTRSAHGDRMSLLKKLSGFAND